MKLVIFGTPVTKKNSQRIIRLGNGRRIIKPSTKFEEYQEMVGMYIPARVRLMIDRPVNVKCMYFMPTHRRVDLVNLLEATCDILVHYRVLADDNSKIIVSLDGSRVLYDKDRPRAEIDITEEDDNSEGRVVEA